MVIDKLALILAIIGALNWGSIGLFGFDVVAFICGGQMAIVSRIIYTLVGLAGCSADCSTMWQIGVDVLAPYRRQGIASALTSGLAVEALRRGLVPFYCCAWANVKSARNAWKSGFRPAWVQLTAKQTLEKKPGHA